MSQELCKAVILKTTNYSDTQKIIHVYSLEKGYLSLISPAMIFKRKSSPVHLMQIVEVEYDENRRANFHKLRSASPLINLSNLYFDIFKMNIIFLWGEALNLLLRNEEKNEPLFEFISHSVEYLNSSSIGVGNFNLFFLYRLTGFIGFKINTSSWKEGFVFNLDDGSFYAVNNNISYISGANSATMIHQLCTCEVYTVKTIILNRQARNILLDIILLFYNRHLNINFNIKSIQVIREVFK